MQSDERTAITVIIPTRERANTLRWTLETCVRQDYERLQILISDNASGDGTRDVVASFADPRIRYVNTGKRVSMSDNWEFALSHVDGGFVTYIGDDDGLLPGALDALDTIIAETRTQAVSWRRAPYYWPDYYDETTRNLLIVPLDARLERRTSSELIREATAFKRTYFELPLLYNSIIDHRAVRAVAAQSDRFFHSITPDVYSGFALASVMETYYYSHRPYTMEGVSRTSNGAPLFNSSPQAREIAQQFFAENTIPFHAGLVNCPSVSVVVAEAFLQAKDHVAELAPYELDLETVLDNAMIGARHAPPEHYAPVAAAIAQIGCLNGIEPAAQRAIAGNPNAPRPAAQLVPGLDWVHKRFNVYCDQFGVRNVYEASLLCRHVLELYGSGLLSPMGMVRTTVREARRQAAKRWPRRGNPHGKRTDARG